MDGATSRAGSAYYFRNTLLHLLLEVHAFHMYKFYPVIVSSRISALVDDFGVVCAGLWITLWQTAANANNYFYNYQGPRSQEGWLLSTDSDNNFIPIYDLYNKHVISQPRNFKT